MKLHTTRSSSESIYILKGQLLRVDLQGDELYLYQIFVLAPAVDDTFNNHTIPPKCSAQQSPAPELEQPSSSLQLSVQPFNQALLQLCELSPAESLLSPPVPDLAAQTSHLHPTGPLPLHTPFYNDSVQAHSASYPIRGREEMGNRLRMER